MSAEQAHTKINPKVDIQYALQWMPGEKGFHYKQYLCFRFKNWNAINLLFHNDELKKLKAKLSNTKDYSLYSMKYQLFVYEHS